jgi:hypothetical protein
VWTFAAVRGRPSCERLSGRPAYVPGGVERMTRYEYRTVSVPGRTPGLKREDPEARLNELGREGFEVVERIEQQFGGTQMLVLAREIVE